MTQQVHIERRRGDTYAEPFALVDDNGDAINITGATFVLTIDPSATPANADANVAELVGVITNAAGGLVEFPLSAPDANLTPKTYYYDMQMTDSGGKVRTVCAGMWIVKQDVSK